MKWMDDWIWVLYMGPDGTKLITRQLRTDETYQRDDRKSVSNLTGIWESTIPHVINWSWMVVLTRTQVMLLIGSKLTDWMEK